MINPAWPEIAKAAPANLHHQMGHDRGRSPQEAVLFFLSVLADSTTARTYPQASLVLKYEFSDVLRNFGPFGNAQKSSGFWRKFAAG